MADDRKDPARHPIRVVARRTGLNPAVLRAWEKRYGVVDPSRSDGGQRLYSDQDVLRLSLLRRAVEGGRSIGQVATLPTESLARLVREDETARIDGKPPEPLDGPSTSRILERAERAVDRMDPGELQRILTRGAMALSIGTLIDEILLPLMTSIGDSWQTGRIGPAKEHLASVEVRRFLDWLMQNVSLEENSAVLVACTPSGEHHEVGAILAAVTAAAEGWKGVYLGPDLPAEEIARAAISLRARIVALSCVNRKRSGELLAEIRGLRGLLPEAVPIVVGGSAVHRDGRSVALEGVEVLGDLQELRGRLRAAGGTR